MSSDHIKWIASICILLSWCNNGIEFGFRVDSDRTNARTGDHEWLIFFSNGREMYECNTGSTVLERGDIFTCNTDDITPNDCVEDYFLQMSVPLEGKQRDYSNQINDLFVDRIIIGDQTYVLSTEIELGDGPSIGSHNAVRYYRWNLGLESLTPADAANLVGGEVNERYPQCYKGAFEDVLTLGPDANKYNNEDAIDVGTSEFNRIFREESPNKILRRICDTCEQVQQEIYYRRITDVDTFELYPQLRDWTSTDNLLDTDFKLYSTLQDAIEDTNGWNYCNYDDPGVGAFRDCGPNGVADACDWAADANSGEDFNCGNEAKFSIYTVATCQASDIATFDWDVLTAEGLDGISGVNTPQPVLTLTQSDLSLGISVELQYFGNASADNQGEVFGVTYVLDFEDFDAHEDAINQPGTCQNRKDDSFTGKDFVDDFWKWSYQPQGDIGTPSFLAYPPPLPEVGSWEVSMKDDCSTLEYTGKFSWTDLRNCKKYGGNGEPYTSVMQTDANWVNLTGSFYINLVSPFWYDEDYGFYRVYQLISQPFVIAVSKVVNVLGSTGINLMSMSVIAVYKQEEGPDSALEHGTNAKDMYADFKLILLTECSDYMMLTRTDEDMFEFDGTGAGESDTDNTQVVTGDFNAELDPENSDCLNNKGFICSQLWEINAMNIACTDAKGRDFSGEYTLTFTKACKPVADIGQDLYDHCDTFLTNHPQLDDNRIALSTDLVWKDEICNPTIFTVQLEASMTFYDDNSFTAPVEGSHLYQVGEDTIYVQVDTDFPDDTLDVFNTKLIMVHICTFDPLNAPVASSTGPIDADVGDFGCFIKYVDGRDNYDNYFYKIYEANAADPSNPTTDPGVEFKDSYTDYTGTDNNVVRFSFVVPNEVARDKLYVMAEIEVELTEDLTRRRVLLGGRRAPQATANKMSHFIEGIGINHGQEIVNKEPKHNEPNDNNNYNPPQEYYPPQQPQQPINPVSPVSPNPNPSFTINLSSPWIIAIGGLLGMILTFNIIFMTYMNCCGGSSPNGRASFMRRGRKKGYAKVDVESEFDSEAQMIGNDDDEQ